MLEWSLFVAHDVIIDWISYLEGADSGTLESQISFEILSDFSDQSLEWEFSDQELSWLLVSSNFSQSNSTRSVSVWLLDTSCGWSGFSCCLKKWWNKHLTLLRRKNLKKNSPWLPIVFLELFLRLIYGRFAWYEPFFIAELYQFSSYIEFYLWN